MTYRLPTTDEELEFHVRMELARRIMGKPSKAPEISSATLERLYRAVVAARSGSPEAPEAEQTDPLRALSGLPPEERAALLAEYNEGEPQNGD